MQLASAAYTSKKCSVLLPRILYARTAANSDSSSICAWTASSGQACEHKPQDCAAASLNLFFFSTAILKFKKIKKMLRNIRGMPPNVAQHWANFFHGRVVAKHWGHAPQCCATLVFFFMAALLRNIGGMRPNVAQHWGQKWTWPSKPEAEKKERKKEKKNYTRP